MTSKPPRIGKRWTITGVIVGAIIGLIVTAIDNLYDLLGLAPQLRTAYQLLGVIGGGYIGATIGKFFDRRRSQR